METAIVASSLVFLLLAVFIVIFLLFHRMRQKENADEKNEMKYRFDQELLRTQLEIQEQTLKTISEEIHDNIGQALSLAKLKLNTLDHNKQEELKEKIADSKSLVSKAIQDLRDLSRSLNTDNIAAMGLLPAIEYELDMIRKSGFETMLDVNGPMIRMEPQKELIVFRIVQETLNNIIKHAEAGKIIVHATFDANKLELSVEDNGIGVDLSPLNDTKEVTGGLGIRNMHSRAKMIGADFKMSSTLGAGTHVFISIPYTHQIK